MAKATKQPATIWGTGIVGFGSYHHKYASGREGDSCLTGFSSRKAAISVNLMAIFPGQEALLSRLGKHRMGKVCLYVNRLDNVDLEVLEQLVVGSAAEGKRRYGQGQGAASIH